MAQALVVKSGENPFLDGNIPYNLILDWTSATGGTVSLGVVAAWNAQQVGKSANPISVLAVKGKLRSVETIPGTSGDKATNQPTSYGLTILDEYGYDILSGNGAARSASVAEKILPSGSTIIINSELTVVITGAGDGKMGRIRLEFEDVGTIKL